MPATRIVPATLRIENGVPYADAYDDVYHSADGGLAQARQVFVGGNLLPRRWQDKERFVILETGFGLGLNFLATWSAWLADEHRPRQLHYVAIEKHPFAAADLAQLHAMWPELDALSAQLRDAWPVLTPGFHRLLLDNGRIVLTLVFGDIAECLPQVDAAADAFYLDGFAPSKNPDMWSPAILSRLNRLAAPQATLATYTVSAAVRRALAQAGFACDKLRGFGRKREMLAGRFEPCWQLPQAAQAFPPARRAVIIGAGIAGCAMAERLCARGWQITLVERHGGPAREASGNIAGIVMPLMSRDDNQVSRLARAAYLFTLRHWQLLGGPGRAFMGDACGVLQLAADAAGAQQQRDNPYAAIAGFAQWLDEKAVRERAGIAGTWGGWLFPQGGWVNPHSLCNALLAACGDRLTHRFAHQAAQLERSGDDWLVHAEDGGVIAQAPVVILANGIHATRLPQAAALPLTPMRGQVTHLPAGSLPGVTMVVCGDGYATPAVQGVHPVGASYDKDGDTDDKQLRSDSQQENLRRLAKLMPGLSLPGGLPLAGRVGFRSMSPDRLPLAGALPDDSAFITGSRLRNVPRLPGVHGLLGYGSRGLTWASFMAELLAARLEGEPLPVERELADAVDPARFALKAYRRGRA